MQNQTFEKVPVGKIGVNRFDLSHEYKTSLRPGYLVPVALIEALPNDRFNVNSELMLRMMPMLAPLMHRVEVTTDWWYVPNRILWPNWEKFITNTPLDGTDVLPAFPTISAGGAYYSKLMNYMGVPSPIVGGNDEQINALPFAAYQSIYNEYYRDQNLIDPVITELIDGNNNLNHAELTTLRRRAWERDYLTAALPSPQKGDPVTIPIAGFQDVPVRVNQGNTPGGVGIIANGAAPNPLLVSGDTPSYGADPGEDLYAETSQLDAQAATINDLRTAWGVQKMLEKWMRAGSRYAEMLRSFFRVTPEDSRLQRPEFILRSTSPVNISEVLNTTGTEDLPQGNMAGHGISYASGKPGFIHVKEHGFIMCIVSVRPKTAYQQGFDKYWLKTEDPFQYAVPELAHLGEQEVLKKEVYAYGAGANDTFGYNPRFQENRFQNSRVTGDLQQSLEFWTWGRVFAGSQSLNQQFIECNPSDGPFAVQDPEQDNLILHCYHHVSSLRVLPKFGIPGGI